MKKAVLAFLSTAALFAAVSFGADNHTQVNVLSYASTNVTSAAAVQLVASTAVSAHAIEVCDTSGQLVTLATGASGSAVDIATVSPSSCIVIPYYLGAGTRLSLKAVNASATSGYSEVSLIP